MEGVIIRHWVETPVRYQEQFADQELDAYKLEHSLYALPGPSISSVRINKHVIAAEKSSTGGNEQSFQVLLDVVQFRPEDIIIQTFEGWLLIKAQHGRRMDEHGFISRSFTRQYKLPNGTETKDLSAVFCHDGILVVEMKNASGMN
ncbi:PREDICTED: heat shock protein beta-3 [Crocodylus porosus]|uniref:Heat shock protein family B (small) member 3 n=1 Tax=Crocodylus porosus TaxID=8502 RepID=A0A7M4G1V8_CROPO|nr:PREDICTED: heat shock protein beta-3 [Crocodylus porosus]